MVHYIFDDASAQSPSSIPPSNVHLEQREIPFATGSDVLYLLEDDALSAVMACAECGSFLFMPPDGADACPLCGSDLVAPAGTTRGQYSRVVDLTRPRSREAAERLDAREEVAAGPIA